MKMLGLVALFIGLTATAPRAAAADPPTTAPSQRERLAVWIDATGADADDLTLADNLADVAISRLAGAPHRELVGTREIRGKLPGIAGPQGTESCFARRDCLVALAGAVSVQRVVTGRVRRQDGGFVVDLALFDLRLSTATISRRRESTGNLADLIQVIQDSVVALVDESQAEPSRSGAESPWTNVRPPPNLLPTASVAAAAAMAPAAATTAPSERSSARGASYLVYASAAAAIVAFGAAAVAGTIAAGEPQGANRKASQADLNRREIYAETADGLVAAGLLTSGLTVWLWLRR